MSTSDTTTVNRISSILLGLRRVRRPSPQRILTHLCDPASSDDYHYLDALATLFSFSEPYDSISAAVEYHKTSSVLYLAASPSAPLPLQHRLSIWINLMQNLSRQVPDASPTSETDAMNDADLVRTGSTIDGPKPWERDYTVLEKALIVEVYRTCHAKLLDVVNLPGGLAQALKKKISEEDSTTLRLLNITGSPLVEKLELLISMAKKQGSTGSLSAEDLLDLHCAAGTVAWFKDEIPIRDLDPLYEAVYGLSHAVDTIIQFASSAQGKTRIDLPWTIVWVDVPDSAPAFLATANAQELAAMVTSKEALRDELTSVFNKWKPFEPAQSGLRTVDGFPDHMHFTGNGVVHPEAALLHYIYKANIAQSIEPYLGCSHPICYPCLMLLEACNWNFNDIMDANIEVGHRCVNFAQLDIAWAYPQEMGRGIYKMLVRDVASDFQDLCLQPDNPSCPPPLGVLPSEETLP